MRRRLLTLAIAASMIGPAAAEAQTPAPAPASPPIATQQAASITPAAEASVVLDAEKPTRARINRLSTACRTVRSADPLTAAYLGLCRVEGDAFTAGLRLPTCKSTDRCRARLNRYSTGLTAQAVAARKLNAALPGLVPDADCRRALRVPQATLTAITRLKSASARLQRAIASGSNARVASGLKRFYAIDRAPLRDHQGRLDRYRASCL